ncbi:MAG: hypothetical protein V4644_01665 [Patescibacteria group bacterium]
MLIVLGIVALLGLIAFIVLLDMVSEGYKLMTGLPWMTWLTFQVVIDMGFRRVPSSFMLCAYYELGNIEVRPLEDLSEEDQSDVDRFGFTPLIIRSYEFRLVKRPRRKLREIKPITRLAWKPAIA